jgi:nucleotide-binding universal stress UspA family protein
MATTPHVLFPFDFSRPAYLTAPFVRSYSSRLGAKITVLSVVPPVWSTPASEVPVLIDEEGRVRERDLQSRLEKVCHSEFPASSVTSAVTLGDPALKITEYAHAHGVTLIMMPTHGFGVFRSLLIGSVTAKVLHDANCPVWTAAHAEEQTATVKPRTILCAMDAASPKTAELVRRAKELAASFDASLRLLHVVPPISDWLAIPSERKLQEDLRTEARTRIEACLAEAGVTAEFRVAVGKISETVTEEARQEGADLLVVGRGTAQSNFGRLRSHVYGVIQQSPCPVISF